MAKQILRWENQQKNKNKISFFFIKQILNVYLYSFLFLCVCFFFLNRKKIYKNPNSHAFKNPSFKGSHHTFSIGEDFLTFGELVEKQKNYKSFQKSKYTKILTILIVYWFSKFVLKLLSLHLKKKKKKNSSFEKFFASLKRQRFLELHQLS